MAGRDGKLRMSACWMGPTDRSWRHPAIGGRVRFTGLTDRSNRRDGVGSRRLPPVRSCGPMDVKELLRLARAAIIAQRAARQFGADFEMVGHANEHLLVRLLCQWASLNRSRPELASGNPY
jgi:hypothetical protein